MSIRLRNIYCGPPCKPLYSNVKTDAVTLSKIKTNGDYIAIPDINQNSIGILPISLDLEHKGPIRIEQHCPLLYGILF